MPDRQAVGLYGLVRGTTQARFSPADFACTSALMLVKGLARPTRLRRQAPCAGMHVLRTTQHSPGAPSRQGRSVHAADSAQEHLAAISGGAAANAAAVLGTPWPAQIDVSAGMRARRRNLQPGPHRQPQSQRARSAAPGHACAEGRPATTHARGGGERCALLRGAGVLACRTVPRALVEEAVQSWPSSPVWDMFKPKE